MTGVFVIWSGVFLAIVRSAPSSAEFLVLIPVAVSATLLGIRGGLVGSLVGVVGISSYHAIAGTGSVFLLPGLTSGVVVVFAAGAIFGYVRSLKTQRLTASRLAKSKQSDLDRFDDESHLLSQLSIAIGKTSAVESIASAANVALSGLIAFDRMALYSLDSLRGTATVVWISGEGYPGPTNGDEFSIENITETDPIFSPQPVGDGAKSTDGGPTDLKLISQRSISDGTEAIALFRLWSNTDQAPSNRDRKYIRSVADQITPALKRASLQTRIERDAKLNAVVAEFAEITHRKLEIDSVVGAATNHIGNYLGTDRVEIAVADLDGRRVTVRRGNDDESKSFGISKIRNLAEVLSDPLADYEPRVVSVEECAVIGPYSDVANALAKSGMGSFIVSNLQHDGELVAQLWIGFETGYAISIDDVEFVARVGEHLASALVNARNAERSRELQQQFLGQNEQFAYMQDVLERAEAELQLSNQKLAEASEAKSIFMSAVAHELKTPLTVIMGYIDLLLFGPGKLDEEQQEFATLAQNSSVKLLALADDLGDVSKVDSGKFLISKKPHDVGEVLKTVVEDLKISVSNSDHRIEFSSPTAVQMFDGDPVRLAQAFSNLITNALKYSPDDRPVEVSLVSAPGKLIIAVADRGLGISEADQERLFAPFFRSTNPEALERDGTGLGLVLVKSIIDEHGGNLVISSEIGVGSTFTVELPLAMNVPEALSA